MSATGSEDDFVTSVDAIVGKELELTVFAKDINAHQALSIDIQQAAGNPNPTVELPNQEWTGPTVCVGNNLATATVGSPCREGWWKRALRYTARGIEVNTVYRLYFQASEVFWGQDLLAAPNLPFALTTSQGLRGSGCCAAGTGICTMDNFRCASFPRAVRHSTDNFFSVRVLQLTPSFVPGVLANARLFTKPSFTFQPVAVPNHPGTPADGAMLPTAYVNCRMPPLGVYVRKADAVEQLSIQISFGGEGFADPSEYGLTYTTNRLFYRTTLANSQDPNDFLLYQGVDWTPQPGSEGRTFRICFRAFDSVSESTTCSTVHVARCMYCTLPGESLVSIAQRFQTNWLQVWAANDPDVTLAEADALAASRVSPWSPAGTRRPQTLEAGLLIRLGPTLHTRHEHTVEEIAARYQTTVRSLLQVNPDLPDGPIPMESELCVLPGICSPHDPAAPM